LSSISTGDVCGCIAKAVKEVNMPKKLLRTGMVLEAEPRVDERGQLVTEAPSNPAASKEGKGDHAGHDELIPPKQ